MGNQTILDILGSVIIGGILLIIILRMNETNSVNLMVYSGELSVQENLKNIAEIIEYDFRKIGYCKDWSQIPNPAYAIRSVDTSYIQFYTDLPTSTDINDCGDGTIDVVTYYLGSKSELSETPNPNDRPLYRRINSDPATNIGTGVTKFYMNYFDATGNNVTSSAKGAALPLGIFNIEMDLVVENPYSYNNDYSVDKSAFYRQIRMAAPNLVRN